MTGSCLIYTTYKNCDDWGMVYCCFTIVFCCLYHIIMLYRMVLLAVLIRWSEGWSEDWESQTKWFPPVRLWRFGSTWHLVNGLISGEATVCRLNGYEVQTVTLAEWTSLHRLDTIGAVWSCCIISKFFMTMCWGGQILRSEQPNRSRYELKGGIDPPIERRTMESSSTSSPLCPQAAACALFLSFLFATGSRALAADDKVYRMFQVSGFQNRTNMNMMLNVQQISLNDRALNVPF